ncbi:protein translocase subunit SecF [Candidatus Woesearchaeota archaeon]|jgi:preprotein translocase subunit SecF|nr:protein translocase subunit SecF [Candidatus Woesearchaeota archaeon]
MASRRERRLLRHKGVRYNKDGSAEEGSITPVTNQSSTTKSSSHTKSHSHKKGKIPPKNFFKKLMFYYEHEYKKLFFIPVAMLLIAFVIIGANFAVTGEFVNKGVSLKGGITITIPYNDRITSVDNEVLQLNLRALLPGSDVSVRALSEAGYQKGVIVDASDTTPDQLIASLKQQLPNLQKADYTIETIGSSLGQSFFKEIITALILAFIFMGIVVFIYFKTVVPSLAVILAAFSDMVITLAIVDLIGLKLSTAGIAAFLMLIGYSVDTDILLTTRVIKQKEGTVFERVISAAKTGLTMNITTLAALIIAFIFTPSEVLKQIMLILIIGLLVDIINTWLQNAAILRYYIEKKGDRAEKA